MPLCGISFSFFSEEDLSIHFMGSAHASLVFGADGFWGPARGHFADLIEPTRTPTHTATEQLRATHTAGVLRVFDGRKKFHLIAY